MAVTSPTNEIAAWPGWEIVRTIGKGGFATVYEIRRNVFGHMEKAALKKISIPQGEGDIEDLIGDGYDEESLTKRFEGYLQDIVREYSMMADMKGCANIVYCDDVRYIQHDDGIGWDIYIKMELLTALTRAIGRDIPEELVLKVGTDICSALVFCEERNVLHRDIKPQNIFMAPDGTYKLGDFGIAKTAERTTSGTKTGTYKYMAPEVYNNRPYGTKADIYSLGLVLYWMLNERRTPFLPLPPKVPTTSEEDAARSKRFSGKEIPPPLHGSEELKRIVLKACAFDPDLRYQSAKEMLFDLNNVSGMPVAGLTGRERLQPVREKEPMGSAAVAAEREKLQPEEEKGREAPAAVPPLLVKPEPAATVFKDSKHEDETIWESATVTEVATSATKTEFPGEQSNFNTREGETERAFTDVGNTEKSEKKPEPVKTVTPPAEPRQEPVPKKNSRKIGAVLLSAALIIGLILFFVIRGQSKPAEVSIPEATAEPTAVPTAEPVQATPEPAVETAAPVVLQLGESSLELGIDEEYTLTLTAAAGTELKWESSDPEVAEVSENGVVLGKSVGKTTVTVSAADGTTEKCEVNVRHKVTGVSFKQQNRSLKKGNTYDFTSIIVISPKNATNKKYILTSSNEEVAIITDKGKVKTVGVGSAVITVTTEDGGFTAECKINVKGSSVAPPVIIG